MSFDFEQFTGIAGSYAPKVSIRNTGQLGLSQGLLRRMGIGDGKWFALLFFDKKRQAIGIQFTQDPDKKGAVKVQKRSVTATDGVTNWSGHISARAFLDFCAIDYRNRKSEGYYPKFDEDGMVIVMLESESADDADDPAEGGPAEDGKDEGSEDVGADEEVGEIKEPF